MTKCTSEYTVDAFQVLVCDVDSEKHTTNRNNENIHLTNAYGLRWYWSETEADK